jgi:hypothetical protein
MTQLNVVSKHQSGLWVGSTVQRRIEEPGEILARMGARSDEPEAQRHLLCRRRCSLHPDRVRHDAFPTIATKQSLICELQSHLKACYYRIGRFANTRLHGAAAPDVIY